MPAAFPAASRLPVDAEKNAKAAAPSSEGELETSITTSAPLRTSSSPSPVTALTPVSGAAAKASGPCTRSRATMRDPIRPVPPTMTIFMILSDRLWVGSVEPTHNRSESIMKIVIVGGTGRIGSRIVARLRVQGPDALAAAPDTGVNAVTGEGLDDVLRGADVVIDVSNSPSLEGAAAFAFFSASTGNLLAAGKAAGIRHHVALSIVGTDRLIESGYFQAKLTQERAIEHSTIPFTIVRATQFFEFIAPIADAGTDGDVVRVPPVMIQPMAADDVAEAVTQVALEAPQNGIVEVGGPE